MIWRRRDGEDNSFVEAGPTLGERFADIWHRQSGVGRILRLSWLVITLPLRLVGNTLGLLLWWRHRREESGISSRQLKHLLQGLPAVIAALGVIACAGVVIGRESYLREVYRGEAVGAFLAERPEDARIYYERLFRLDGGTAETRLFLGLTLEKLGQKDESEHLIQGVANGDAGGDPRANRWVAAQMLLDPATLRDRSKLRTAYSHLLRAERGLPRDPDVKLDLAKYHLALGETKKAVPKLVVAASADPALNYDLARLYIATGQPESARKAMERAERHFRKVLEEKGDDHKARLLLATCVANNEQNEKRFEDALAILGEGYTQDPDGPYGAAIAKIYVAAYDRRVAAGSADAGDMIAALREALRFDPQSIDAAVRLATFGEPASAVLGGVAAEVDPKVEAEAREMLEQLLATGNQPPAVHMALGLKSWRSEDLKKAQWHFERAYEMDPSLAGVANNLAWVLSHQKNADLERALAVINPIVEKFPEVAHFRDTRGEIYLQLKQWTAAISDLEQALQSLHQNPRIHDSLATAYEGLDQPEMAKKHRTLSQRLSQASAKP